MDRRRHDATRGVAILVMLLIMVGVRAPGGVPGLRRVTPDSITADGHIVRGGATVIAGEIVQAQLPAGPSASRTEAGYWTAMGSGTNSVVNAVAIRDTDIFVGGFFSDAGGTTANHIARWNGSQWFPLGAGVNGFMPAVYAIACAGNMVYAGGVFVTAGGQSSQGIAQWDGSAWHTLGGGVNGSVYAIAIDGPNVYAGGYFTEAGGVAAHNIARWDGTSWHPMGTGVDDVVRALTVYQGSIIAGGDFDSSGVTPVPHCARWDGASWVPLGGGADQAIYTFARIGSDLYAGGVFSFAGGVPASYVARWNGSVWSAVGSGVNSIVYSLAAGDAGLYVGGLFTMAGGLPANQVARWDGTSWNTLYGGVNTVVFAAEARGSSLWIGGAFSVAGAIPATHVAQWHEVQTTTLAMLSGWNLASLPRATVTTDPSLLFPGRTGAIFQYNNGTQNYESASTLLPGNGFWVKYDVSSAITITGSDLDSVRVIASQPGWVLAGSISSSVPLSSLSTVPQGAIEGIMFRYNRITQTYEPANEITPGEGYWIKVTQPCIIRIVP